MVKNTHSKPIATFKTFEDLEHEDYPIRMDFENGYGVSVIRYGIIEGRYELGVIRNGMLCYTTPITDDVVEFLTPENVTELMRQVQELPPVKESA